MTTSTLLVSNHIAYEEVKASNGNGKGIHKPLEPQLIFKDVDTDANRVTVGSKGAVVWLTGLPASGKTTTARFASKEIKRRYPATRVEHLDGDAVRKALSPELGFSPEDRTTHLKRVAYLAQRLALHGVVVLCSFVSPTRSVRDEIRGTIEAAGAPFIEVYMNATVATCEQRDETGLYKLAKEGRIKDFTGVSAPYEAPLYPEVILDSENQRASACARMLVDYLRVNGYLKPVEDAISDRLSETDAENDMAGIEVDGGVISEIQDTSELQTLRADVTRMTGALESILETVNALEIDDMSKYMITRIASLALRLNPPARPDGNPPIASALPAELEDVDDMLSMLTSDDFEDDIIASEDVEDETDE